MVGIRSQFIGGDSKAKKSFKELRLRLYKRVYESHEHVSVVEKKKEEKDTSPLKSEQKFIDPHDIALIFRNLYF